MIVACAPFSAFYFDVKNLYRLIYFFCAFCFDTSKKLNPQDLFRETFEDCNILVDDSLVDFGDN